MQSVSVSSSDRERIESFVAEWLATNGVPGAAVAVVDADEIRYQEGFGARDLEDDTPVTPETRFGIASCTKSFTALAIMQLVETGELALDDHVADYLPHVADAPGDPITVEDLLTHTSGLPSDETAGPRIFRHIGLDTDPVPLTSDADFRRHVQGSLDRRVTDRDAFFYYNSGYALLATLVEELTDDTFPTYVTEHVLEPAGLDRATFYEDAFEADDDRLTPYFDGDDGPEAVPFPFDRHTHGSGGLIASVRDLARTIRLYLGDGRIDGERIVAPETVGAMTTPHGDFGSYLDGTSVGYGYGLMTEPYLDDRLVGHGGDLAVSTAWFGYLEDAGVGVAVACNTSPDTHPSAVGMGILAILDDQDPEAVQPHYRLEAALDAVTGDYTGYRDITEATVERSGANLRLTIDMGAGADELLCVPTEITDDVLRCSTAVTSGFEREVRFEYGTDPVDCFYERLRLQQTD
jgi:CubicO group peptidase (beta-lactamase class C family)